MKKNIVASAALLTALLAVARCVILTLLWENLA